MADGGAESARDQLRAAYDAMIERDGAPLNPAPVTDGEEMAERPRRKRRRVWPWIVIPLVLIIAGVAAVGIIFFQQAMQVKDDLTAAKGKLSSVTDSVKTGDTAAVEKAAADVTKLVANANGIVSGQLWDILGGVPVVGANVHAVQQTTKATHVLVTDAMPPALELLKTLDVKNLKLEGGGFNLEPFRAAQQQLPAVNAAFADAKTYVGKIDRTAILSVVDDNIGQLVDIIDESQPALATAEKYLPTMLTLLGADGPRNYALLFQNNAEMRSTGGNPGTGAILHVENGKIDMREDAEVANYAWVGYHNADVPEIEPAEKAQLFDDDTIHFVQNYTRYPDFRDTGASVQKLWQHANGSTLDGVFSIDPIVLSYMLRVTGPVEVPGESTKLTSKNAVKVLLSDTYERFGSDGLAADVYFAKASAAIFDKVSAGGWDVMKMWDQLKQGAEEQRIYMWFPSEADEKMAVEFGLDGAVTSDNKTKTQTGIYLNDESVGKLQYWLSTSMSVQCDAKARTVTTAVTMKNSIPDSIQSSYTLGARSPKYGHPRTTMLIDVLSFAVPGGKLTATDPSADELGRDRTGAYNGREAKSLGVALAQGETRTVSFTSTVPDGDAAPLTVRYTPTTSKTPVTIADSCGTMFPGTDIPKK